MASETTLHGLLKQMVEMGASDLHLTTSLRRWCAWTAS